MWQGSREGYAKWGPLCTSRNPQWHHCLASLLRDVAQSTSRKPLSRSLVWELAGGWNLKTRTLCLSLFLYFQGKPCWIRSFIFQPPLLRNLPFSRMHWLTPHSSPSPLPSAAIALTTATTTSPAPSLTCPSWMLPHWDLAHKSLKTVFFQRPLPE